MWCYAISIASISVLLTGYCNKSLPSYHIFSGTRKVQFYYTINFKIQNAFAISLHKCLHAISYTLTPKHLQILKNVQYKLALNFKI